jgi:aldose sugar dehydrogenase
MKRILYGSMITLLISAGVVFSSHAQSVVNEVIEDRITSEEAEFRLVQVVEGLEHPWAVNWLSDGRMVVNERPGRMLLVDGESITSLDGLPKIDTDEDQLTAPEGGNQGGLLDLVPHPNHADNGWIYFTYSSPGDPDGNFSDDDYATGTSLGRARINSDGTGLIDFEELYAQSPRTEPGRHYGSRIVFPGDGTVVFSIGDRGIRYPSQNLADPAGSMIRIYEDGGVPEDNPFVGAAPGNLRPEIFSYGHRNNQGIAIDPETGNIWTTEHGPSGGDQVFLILAGKNYGWPTVAQGVEYSSGAKIGAGTSAPGVEPPKHVWEDSMAPSGLAFYTGNISEWNGNLFAGSLLRQQLFRLVIEGEEVVHDEVLLSEEIGRIRDVRMGPDGNLYLATDHNNGGIYRIEPR